MGITKSLYQRITNYDFITNCSTCPNQIPFKIDELAVVSSKAFTNNFKPFYDLQELSLEGNCLYDIEGIYNICPYLQKINLSKN